MKRFLISMLIMFVMLFGCTQVTENVDSDKGNDNQQTNNNQNNSNTGDEQKPSNPPVETNSITITLIGADGKMLDELETIRGKEILLSSTVEKLSHWNTQADGNGLSYKDSVIFYENANLYAILLAENTYTITYMLDGGTANPQNSYSFTEDNFVALKNPIRDGYTFAGWYENRDFSGDIIKGWGPGNKTADVTLYAKWEKIEPEVKITITFDTNGYGVTTPTAIETLSGKNVNLPVINDSKFSHWSTSPNAKDAMNYKETATFIQSVTLYAIFLTENTYSITYMLDGGVNNPKNPYTFTKDDFIGLENPTRDGCTFAGWYETQDFSGDTVKGWFRDEKTSNVTLYAKWEKNIEPPLNVTITFDANGSELSVPEAIETTVGTNVDLPIIDNSKFSHWNTRADGNGLSYKGTVSFSENVTLYAILLKGEIYTITYELNGGIANPQNPYSFTSDDIVALKNPTRDGYVFAGWYETQDFYDNALKGWFPGDKNSNVKLYAKWDEKYNVDNKVLATGGNGVYSYTLDIADIADSSSRPSFSIYLMTDEAVKACSLAGDFYQAPKKKPIYQICAYGDLRTNIDVTGNYAVYGNNYDSFRYKYYTGVAAAVTKSTLSVIVDMTKIAKTDLKSYWGGGYGANITEENTVDLTGYKPYIARLGKKENDPDNYIMHADWWGDLMKMTANATFPTSLNKYATDVLSHYAGEMNGWNHESLNDNSFIFTANSTDSQFCFTEGTWSLKACGATITALNEEVQLFINNGDNISFANGVLTVGNKYIVTLIIKSDNIPYVKVSEVDSVTTAISINSTNHKTSYFVGSSLDVNNLTIKVTRNDGTKQIINVSSDMVSGFDSSKVGTQTLTVTYGSYTATYDIEIKELQTTATSSNVADIISELPYSSEPYTIKVTGSITSFTLETIRNAINDNWIRINLDLSETTGLTSIVNGAISGCDRLISIIIPDSVTTIGYGAFSGCSSLSSVTIPDGVTTIGSQAFYNCSSLTSITIPDGVTEIGCDTFSRCSKLAGNEYDNAVYLGNESNPYLVLVKAKNRNITSCEINASTKTITDYAFEYCSSLSSVTIPDSVTSIGSSAFKDCSSLTTFNVGANNENYSSSDDGKILYNKDKTQIIAYPSATGNITIPDGVTEIKESEFAGSESLTSIVIPDSVTKIGSQAFYNCSNLASVTIGNGVKEIDWDAFFGCSNLTSVTIPDSVTKIGSQAFCNCSSLTSVTIGNGVKEIDNGAFNNCGNLKFNEYKDGFYLGNEDNPYLALIKIKSKDITSFEINSATKIIVSSMFDGCSSLTSITIPDSVASIGSQAFYNCSSLTSITIPDSVTSIGIQAFYNCNSLTSVTIPDGVTTINSSTFNGCSSLTSITIPDGVTKIDWSAFSGCSSLTSITIPDGVTEISHGAFNNCDNLETFDVDRNNKNYCTSDDGRILYNKDKTILLQCAGSVSGDIIIPDSVTSIEGSAFSGCSSLASVTIPDSVTSIGSQAFSGCSNLTSVTIPDSVTSIGNDAFSNCNSLTSVTISDSVTKIDWNAFSGCSSLTSVTIPDSVTVIGSNAFNWCDNLESITIPDSITVIGEKAFIGCLSLKTVNYKGTKAQWDNIVIDDYNYYLTGATINYNYSGE